MTIFKICITLIVFFLIYLSSSLLVSNILFYHNANGSLIKFNAKVIGSQHIGQKFTSSKYFFGRASAQNYKSNLSGNSNYPFYSNAGALVVKLNHNTLNSNIKDLNLITESASGLDPHITLNGALAQAKRIAASRNLKIDEVNSLLEEIAFPRAFGLFGDKIINVLELNIALDNKDARKT